MAGRVVNRRFRSIDSRRLAALLVVLAGIVDARGHERPVVDAAVDDSTPPAPFRPREFPDGQAWMLENGMAWGIGFSDAAIFVPQGFVHDRNSVPGIVWSLIGRTRPAVIHDYLYWAQPCTRVQADNLLMIAMKEAGVPWMTRQLVYQGVRLRGESMWSRNSASRALGWPRLNPYGYVPDNLTWPQLQARMFHEGIRDVEYEVPDHFCHYGNSQRVPGPSE